MSRQFSQTVPDSGGLERADVLGCHIDRLDMGGTLARCEALIASRGMAQHVAINAAKLIALRRDAALREIVERCELISADGQAIVWASKLLGDPLPSRVAGIDLMQELLSLAERRGYRVFILGAKPHVLGRAVRRIREQHPQISIAGARDGYFHDEHCDAVAAEVANSGADILFVAMPSPRKEYWLSRYGRTTGVPFVMGVGGSVDVIAGEAKRAPQLLQRLGLEWLYRLLQEPRRMFRRYAVTNTRFLCILAVEVLRRRTRPRRQDTERVGS